MFERCLYFNLNALTRKINRIWAEAFEAFELSPSHAYLLRLVIAEPGLSQQNIADELRLEKSTVTRFVEALEERDLLRREKNGREQFVFPTQQAVSIGVSLEAQGAALYRRMTRTMGAENVKDLVGSLRETAAKL